MTGGYRHSIPVRYAEVDMQQVVFNSHYLAYVDDAMSQWMRSIGLDYSADGSDGFDIMVRHAEIDWHGSATYGDTLSIDCSVARWGTTSFDVRFDIEVREQPIVEIVLTYVGVVPGTATTMAVPERFRAALSGATTA